MKTRSWNHEKNHGALEILHEKIIRNLPWEVGNDLDPSPSTFSFTQQIPMNSQTWMNFIATLTDNHKKNS